MTSPKMWIRCHTNYSYLLILTADSELSCGVVGRTMNYELTSAGVAE